MDPDLAITIGFVCEVLLFALAFAFYVAHEAHAQTAAAPRSGSRREGSG
ncbi:MAG TPA: hypothetical protein VFG75_06385 [Gaiella sp.]|nr:hypothetical protein [Gaiella sp.]